MNFQIILQTPAGPQGLSIGLMMLFLRHASLPIFLALVAAGIAHVWQGYSGFTDIRAIIIGCALFCVFMVLLHHAQFIWQTRQTGRKLSALFGLEDNLLRRIGDIEAGQANALVLEDLQQRIGTLEAMVKELNQPDPKAAIHAAVEQGEGNVVVLKTKASHSGKGSVGDFKASHRVYRPAIDELLAGENLSIKLQPIIHLMSKEVVAVEAFAFLETRNGQQAVAEIVSSMSDEQLCLTDRIIVKRLGGIARKMESDGQLLPIHYTFVSMKVARHPTWSKICNMLKADAKLAKVLVPQISMALFRRLDEREMTRFLEFKEFGAKPCITECQGVKTIVQMATQHRISMLKLTVSELLSYTHKEGERVADSLLPQLVRVGVETVATHVEKAHQAANLIDLDLSLAQGDFISPARSLKGENSQSPRPSADISG